MIFLEKGLKNFKKLDSIKPFKKKDILYNFESENIKKSNFLDTSKKSIGHF